MIGFEIGHLSLEQVLQRLEPLKEMAIFPVNEDGEVVEDDPLAHDSAREIRLLMQRTLELDVATFLEEMQRLFFHLFAADHEHYRDLLLHAAQRDPRAVCHFAVTMIASEDVIFIDDQYTLHHLIDVLERLGQKSLLQGELLQLTGIFRRPFFRLPSLHARLIKFLGPLLNEQALLDVRRLFEMDWIPADELNWKVVAPFLAAINPAASAVLMNTPLPQPQIFEDEVQLKDFESFRWTAGLETTPYALRFRLLGCLVAGGPLAGQLFFEASEAQPESAFHRDHFETKGQLHLFLCALDRLREEIVREAHRSREWFELPAPERTWPWMRPIPDPWPQALRDLPMHWGEFANVTDQSDFSTEHETEIKALDRLAEKIAELLNRQALPSADDLQEAQALSNNFLVLWEKLLPGLLQRLDVIP